MVQNINQLLSSPRRLSQKVLKRRDPQRRKDKSVFRACLSTLFCNFVALWFKAIYLLLGSCQKEWPAIPVFDNIFY